MTTTEIAPASILSEQVSALLYLASDEAFRGLPDVVKETVLNIAHEKAEQLNGMLGSASASEGG